MCFCCYLLLPSIVNGHKRGKRPNREEGIDQTTRYLKRKSSVPTVFRKSAEREIQLNQIFCFVLFFSSMTSADRTVTRLSMQNKSAKRNNKNSHFLSLSLQVKCHAKRMRNSCKQLPHYAEEMFIDSSD